MTRPGSRFDVVVVGGGPAGAVAGYELARRGVDVLILERQRIPRQKICAGGLQARVLDRLPLEARALVLNECSGIAFTRRFGDGFVRRSDRPLVYQVDRCRFDEFLLCRAVGAGARLREGFPVVAVESSDGTCRVRGGAGERIRSDFVVFGDGAGGIGYRTLNDRERRFVQLGVTCEAPIAACRRSYDRSLMSIDWGSTVGAYAWVFPKDDRLVIGCCGPARELGLLTAYLETAVRRLEIDPGRCTRPRAWPMPSFRDGVRLAGERAVLVGDAAGMIDPMSGEGVAPAIESGRLAAEAICHATATGAGLERTYRELVDRRLLPQLRSQMRIRRFCALAPGTVHRLFATNERLWRLFCAMVRGEIEAPSLRRSAPFAPLWPVIDAAAWVVSAGRWNGAPTAASRQLDRLLGGGGLGVHPALAESHTAGQGRSVRQGVTA